MSSEYVLSGPPSSIDFDKRPFAQIIFESLKKNENRTAFIDVVTGEKVTYEKVLNKSLALVSAFQKLGIEKGDIICFLVENHINYFIPFISALFCGITSHLINPEYSNYELKHILNISKPRLIISSNYSLQKALYIRSNYDYVATIINLDRCNQKDVFEMSDLIQLYKNRTTSLNFEGFDESNLDAIIINSSGTTGLPKGVLLTHLNLKYNINYFSHDQYFDITSEDVLLLYLPFFHMLGLLLFIAMITTGCKAIIFPKFDLRKVLKSVEEYRIEKLFVVPPIAVQLSKSQLIGNYDLSSLKYVFCGAAPVGREVEKLFKARFGFKLRQIYGLTELAGITTVCSKSSSLSNVGKLIPGSLAKILDVNTEMALPPSKAGEICFKGPFVMKGYYGNPEATENIIDVDGYLHTGDWGYYDEDGNFYIVDRLKDIIKHNGWQVSPAELEDLLKSHTNIKDAAVIGIPDELAGEVAMALVVKELNSDITVLEIIAFVDQNVIMPKRLHGGVIFVDEIPKNASGKILRRKLRKEGEKFKKNKNQTRIDD